MFNMTLKKLMYSQAFGLSFAGMVYMCMTAKEEECKKEEPMTKRKALDIILSNMVDELRFKYPDGNAKFGKDGLLTQ